MKIKKAGAGVYRNGFNGKENDNEVKGEGNQIDYGNRIYDPRGGRFYSVDPLFKKYPELSSYQFASNSPIQAIDLDGLEQFHYTRSFDSKGQPQLTLINKTDIVDRVQVGWRNSTSAFNDGAIPIYETRVNQRKEYVVRDTRVGYIDVNGGFNGQREVEYPVNTTYQSFNDALFNKNGKEDNGTLKFYAQVGLQNIYQEYKEHGAGGGNRLNGKLSNSEVRMWYNTRLKNINTAVDFTEENARVLSAQRNVLKAEARSMMADRKAAAALDITDPIRPFNYYIEKYSKEGYSGTSLWEKIINGSAKPNPDVNARFGIKK